MRPGILVALFGIVIGNLYGLAVTISGVMKPQWEEHPGGNARLLPGTGPFRFVEFKPNEWITLTRNPDYQKSGRPYLDGIEFTIIRDMSTANLAFIAGKTDWIATTIPLMKDITSRAPAAICEVTPGGISRNLLINRDRPPFNDPEMRRAMALSIDRRALIDIISEGQGDIGGVMQPLPEGLWGIPEEVLKTLPGYDPDVQKNRGEAREIMRNLGYGSGVFLVSLAHARARLEKSKCDDRVAIQVIDKFDDALLQFVCGLDPDVAEHGPGCFGEEPLDEG